MAGSWKVGAVVLVALVSGVIAPVPAGAKSSPRTDVEVFMKVDATAAQTKAVGAVIRRSHSVRKYTFLTKADAYREFKRQFVDQPDLVATTTADHLPTSFRIALVKGAKPKPLIRKVQNLAGVDAVKTFDQDHSRIEKLIERACNEARSSTVDFEVFLESHATAVQTAAVRAALNHAPEVAHVKFISKADAFREMSRLFADSPNLTATLDPDAPPASFRVELRKHAHAKELARALEHLAGVEEVKFTASLRVLCNRSEVRPTLDPAP